jgi:hypothetical protein
MSCSACLKVQVPVSEMENSNLIQHVQVISINDLVNGNQSSAILSSNSSTEPQTGQCEQVNLDNEMKLRMYTWEFCLR